MIALIEAHRAGLLARAHWLPNLAAGVVVGIVALPRGLAFAKASRAPPGQGGEGAGRGGPRASRLVRRAS
ncbi:MAG: hypothetical protein ACK4R8_10505, partial [Thiobacillus sp.]